MKKEDNKIITLINNRYIKLLFKRTWNPHYYKFYEWSKKPYDTSVLYNASIPFEKRRYIKLANFRTFPSNHKSLWKRYSVPNTPFAYYYKEQFTPFGKSKYDEFWESTSEFVARNDMLFNEKKNLVIEICLYCISGT